MFHNTLFRVKAYNGKMAVFAGDDGDDCVLVP